jgi:hypothetical protein|tara:strand:- start:1872 stop:2003 length:132 start_codon:yes stop_codon:yes gene_type:complete
MVDDPDVPKSKESREFLQRFFYSPQFSPMQEKILLDLVEKLKK